MPTIEPSSGPIDCPPWATSARSAAGTPGALHRIPRSVVSVRSSASSRRFTVSSSAIRVSSCPTLPPERAGD